MTRLKGLRPGISAQARSASKEKDGPVGPSLPVVSSRAERIPVLQQFDLRRANQARPVTDAAATAGLPPSDLPVCLARFPAARLWLKDESLEDSANLPDPDVIAQEIVEDLEAALQQFAAIAQDLTQSNSD